MQFAKGMKMARIVVMQNCISYAVAYAQFNKIKIAMEHDLQV